MVTAIKGLFHNISDKSCRSLSCLSNPALSRVNFLTKKFPKRVLTFFLRPYIIIIGERKRKGRNEK